MRRRENPGRSWHGNIGRSKCDPPQSPSRTLHLYSFDTKGPFLRQGTTDTKMLPCYNVGEYRVSLTRSILHKEQTTLKEHLWSLVMGTITNTVMFLGEY